jgi:sulfite exporter TauE/SafE
MTEVWVALMRAGNTIAFSLSVLVLLFLSGFAERLLFAYTRSVALRMVGTALVLVVLATVIQILYLLLIHRYEVSI